MSWFSRSNVLNVALLAGVLAAVPAGFAFARGPDDGPRAERQHEAKTVDDVRERMGMIADRALSKVDATPAQRSAVDAILDDAAPQAFETRTEVKQLRRELRGEFTKATLDEGRIEKLRKQGVGLADDNSKLLTDTMLAIAEVLTPEQRAILGEELAKRTDGFEGELE